MGILWTAIMKAQKEIEAKIKENNDTISSRYAE